MATATVCSLLNMECDVYMGKTDVERQAVNVERMRMLGTRVIAVEKGSATLKSAINEAFRDWVRNVRTTHYLLGSVVGPHPFPAIVADFQSVIGHEARRQVLRAEKRLPDHVIACVGGGSNAIGIFRGFLRDPSVGLIGVEAGGTDLESGPSRRHAHAGKAGHPPWRDQLPSSGRRRSGRGRPFCFRRPRLPRRRTGAQPLEGEGRAHYDVCFDSGALDAFHTLARTEGILPALESAHALGYLARERSRFEGQTVIVNLSGRGDKDMEIVKSGGASHG